MPTRQLALFEKGKIETLTTYDDRLTNTRHYARPQDVGLGDQGSETECWSTCARDSRKGATTQRKASKIRGWLDRLRSSAQHGKQLIDIQSSLLVISLGQLPIDSTTEKHRDKVKIRKTGMQEGQDDSNLD